MIGDQPVELSRFSELVAQWENKKSRTGAKNDPQKLFLVAVTDNRQKVGKGAAVDPKLRLSY
jgi:hypothetical protein